MNKEALIVKCVAHVLDELLVITKDKNQIVDAAPAIKFSVRDLVRELTGDAGDHVLIDRAVSKIISQWAD